MSRFFVGDTGISVEVNEDGFLSNPDQWNEEVARALASHEGISSLNQSKMAILRYLREYFEKNHNFPILRQVCRKVGASANCISEEFVDPMKAWKIAGLPKPPSVFFTTFDGKNYFPNPFY